jgi:geranylgeranyl diphosphate synthase type II
VKEYGELLTLFAAHLNSYSSALQNREPAELYEPEAYILTLGGKRVRPLLALVGCDLFGRDAALALNSALAVELFHNFSLIHDDILDAAPLRRNKPTVHTRWNTNIAILSGDVMLVKAFQVLTEYDASIFKKLSTLLQKTSIEVCEGQQQDMNFENAKEVTVEQYLKMIEYKTAVLLGCSLQMGAIVAEASTTAQEHLYEFGKNLGIAFQLNDDLLDAFAQNGSSFGKQPGGDIISNKKTFLLLKALALSNDQQKKEIERLMNLQNKEEKIKGMISIFETLDVRKHCIAEADRYTHIAIDCLEKISADPSKKQKLKNFAVELLQRDK